MRLSFEGATVTNLSYSGFYWTRDFGRNAELRISSSCSLTPYFNEEDLRHRVQLQLNRGEHRHSLARWIFFADQGEFRTGDYQEIMNKASCLSLVSNAILVWNTLQISRIVDTLRQTAPPLPSKTWPTSPHCSIAT
jgi:TnpA family transposase